MAFYPEGSQHQNQLLNAAGSSKSRWETRNLVTGSKTYIAGDLMASESTRYTPSYIKGEAKDRVVSLFPQKSSVLVERWEKNSLASKSPVTLSSHFTYDNYGNIISLRERDGEDNALYLKIDYSLKISDSLYRVALPGTLKAYSCSSADSSKLLRRRKAGYDSKGRMTSFSVYDGIGGSYTSSISWNSDGQLASIEDPPGNPRKVQLR